MVGFYRTRGAGTRKAAALRRAQLGRIAALRKKRHGVAHPFFRAGLVLIGDWR